MTTELKLSDAIEAGWKLAPQSWNHGWAEGPGPGQYYGACALGAAYIAVDQESHPDEIWSRPIRKAFPQLNDTVSIGGLPEDVRIYQPEEETTLFDLVQCLNDA
jgi:hypothetical protein